MKKNMGITDKVIRVIIALAVIGAYFSGSIGGTLALILLALSAIFIATSALGFCPLYMPFGIKTCKSKD